jgi:hypothetical protein
MHESDGRAPHLCVRRMWLDVVVDITLICNQYVCLLQSAVATTKQN